MVTTTSDSTPLQIARYGLGMLCLITTWAHGKGIAGQDYVQYITTLFLLSCAVLLFGAQSVLPKFVCAWYVALLIMLGADSTYLAAHIAGLAGLLLAGSAVHMGQHSRYPSTGLPWILTGITIAAVVNALEGLLQWFGLADALWQLMIVPGARGVAFGTFRQPNLFATFLNIGIIATLWLVHLRRLTQAMAWFLVFLQVFAVAASGSRTGSLEIVALALVGLWLARHQRAAITRLMLGAALFLAVAMVVLPVAAQLHGFGFATSVERAAGTGQDTRLLIWHNTLALISQHPWFGWGWREMAYAHYSTLITPKFHDLLNHAHNLPLQLAVEFGVPVALAFCATALWAIYKGQPWKRVITDNYGEASPESHRVFAWLILLDIVGLHSMLEFPLWYAGFLFLAGWATGYLLPPVPARWADSLYNRIAPRAVAAIAIGLIALTAVAWRQYADVIMMGSAPFNDRAAQREALKYGAHAELFRGYVDFSELNLTDVTPDNALAVRKKAEKLLHFSPEPAVIRPLLLSLWYLHDVDALRFHVQRFCQKYPSAFERWSADFADHPMRAATGLTPTQCNAPVVPPSGT